MNESNERWLPAPGWENLYEVSDQGRVRSLRKNLILRPSYSNTGGYGLVMFCSHGQRYGRYVHRLVAEAFLGPCPEGQEVRHKDDDPRNARLSNLEYGTSGQNKNDQVEHGNHFEGCKDRCDNGHEFTPKNTRITYYPDGSFRQRVCRACGNEKTKRQRREKVSSGLTCIEEGCDKFRAHKGLCEMHYVRQWRAERERKVAS